MTISDNGIGLSHDDLISSLGTIARSGSKAFCRTTCPVSRHIRQNQMIRRKLIGQFGVGFYASFMVADKVEVLSLKAGETQAHLWSSDGVSGYDISPAEKPSAGTDITLYLKKDCKDFLEEQRIGYLVKKYSDHLLIR